MESPAEKIAPNDSISLDDIIRFGPRTVKLCRLCQGGVAAGFILPQLVKSKTMRKAAVALTVKGMSLKGDARTAYKSIKAEDKDVTEILENEEVPLAQPQTAAWALLNLLVAVLAFVFTVLLITTFKRNKKKDETDEEREARMAAEAERGEEPEENVRNKKSGIVWRIISMLLGILAPIVFFLTEDIRNPMIFTDRWTLLMIIILVVQVVGMLLMKHARNREDDNGSHPLTICAERVSFNNAILEGKSDFEAICIVGGSTQLDDKACEYISPCGACRQVRAEFCRSDFDIILANGKGDFIKYSLEDLLPICFSLK